VNRPSLSLRVDCARETDSVNTQNIRNLYAG
jgi:hypothetical protein